MSTFKPDTKDVDQQLKAADFSDVEIAIVTAQWNGHITNTLCQSAFETLEKYGVDTQTQVKAFNVPGTIELVPTAATLSNIKAIDAIIVFGCVIRGDTPHFDYVCLSATQGVTEINARGGAPVIFGVLTVDNEVQALERMAGGEVGDKGAEAAQAALEMILVKRNIQSTYKEYPQ